MLLTLWLSQLGVEKKIEAEQKSLGLFNNISQKEESYGFYAIF